jgi:hypothetical protein
MEKLDPQNNPRAEYSILSLFSRYFLTALIAMTALFFAAHVAFIAAATAPAFRRHR